MRYLAALFIAGLLLSSCEKVIDVELNEAEQKLVIEAVVSNDTAQNYVNLSLSGGFYATNNFAAVEGAAVGIEDENGNYFPMAELVPGVYTNSSLVGELNTSYTLTVIYDNVTYTATTFIPSPVNIDTLEYEYVPASSFADEGAILFANFTDPANETNYYRFRITDNGDIDNNWYLRDDGFVNGLETTYAFFQRSFDDGDFVEVEMVGVDATVFRYFEGLEDISTGQGAAPGNPTSNIQGDALGFFGGYSVDKKSVLINI